MQGLYSACCGRADWTLTRASCRRARRASRRCRAARRPRLDAGKPVLTVRGLNKRFGSLVVAAGHQSGCASVPAAQPDRPERRRQDDVLQHADRPAAAPTPAASVFNGHEITNLPVHRAHPARPGRSFQILSVFPQPDRVRKCACRGAGAEHRQSWACGAMPTDYEEVNARTWSLLAAVGLEERAAEPCANLVAWRAAAAGDRHLARHRREAAAAGRTAGRSRRGRSRGGRRADPQAGRHPRRAADRARHRPRAGVVRPHHRAAPGPHHRRRQAGRGRAATRGRSPPISAPRGSGPRRRRAAMPDRAGRASSAAAGGRTSARRLRRQPGAGRSVDLIVHEGEAVALLGRNGVGKTTMLRAITGTVRSSAGRIALDGTRHHPRRGRTRSTGWAFPSCRRDAGCSPT